LKPDTNSIASQPARSFPGQAVLVVALSRCGTSYLAGFLRAGGVDFGDHLGHSGYVNPRGFFEDRRLVDFHKQLLAKTEPRGAVTPILATPVVRSVTAQEEEEAVRILQSLAKPGLWGWKDPRTLLFIDFWLKLLPEAKLIVPIRHPIENYYSYLKRIRVLPVLNPAWFFRAWVRQSERLLEVTRSHAPRVYVFDAQTAYRQPDLLWTELSAFLKTEKRSPASWPEFHENEFTRLLLTERACRVFEKQFPKAAETFQCLNEAAGIRFQPLPGSSPVDLLFGALGAAFAPWRTIRGSVPR
jgi:O-antigen biosynthesis protein